MSIKTIVAIVWAVVVGSLMAGAASLLDLPSADVVLIGVLGGLGAAIFIVWFAKHA